MRKLVLLLFAACTACSGGAHTAPSGAAAAAGVPAATSSAAAAAPSATAASGTTLARIEALVGTPSCSSDEQCHTLALGARACGGPERYLAWSSARTQDGALRTLGEAYKEEQRKANAASGMMSTCQFLMDPGATCKAGTCQLGGGGALAR
jgi:hypothetical protein